MSKLQTLSKCLQLNCLQVNQLLPICYVMFGTWRAFMNIQRIFKDRIKVFHLHKLFSQSRFNGTLVIEKLTIVFMKAGKNLVVWQKRNVLIKKSHEQWIFMYTTGKSFLLQISGDRTNYVAKTCSQNKILVSNVFSNFVFVRVVGDHKHKRNLRSIKRIQLLRSI